MPHAAPMMARCSAAARAGSSAAAGRQRAAPPTVRCRSPRQLQPRQACGPAGRPVHRAPTAQAAQNAGGSWLDDGIEARPPVAPDPALYGADLAPVPAQERTFSTWDMTALWIGLVVSVSSWLLAGGLVELG
ncbi:hypothetical protein ABPG75_012895 [Micractinium tetrahymenae]